MAHRSGTGHTGWRHGAGCAGERDFCGVSPEGSGGIRDDSRLRGFIVVALVGGAAEMGSAFSGARKNGWT